MDRVVKKLFIIFFIIISISSAYAEDIEKKLSKARELSWAKEYKEAEKLYKEILQEVKNKEIVFGYSNMLAWSGRIDEAIEFLNELEEENDVLLKIATFLTWKGEEKKAVKIFLKLQNSGYELSELGQNIIKKYEETEKQKTLDNIHKLVEKKRYKRAYRKYMQIKRKEEISLDSKAEDFINWYKNYKKIGLKYSYIGELGEDYSPILGENFPLKDRVVVESPKLSIKYDHYGKFTLLLNRNYRYVDKIQRKYTDSIDFYIKSWYIYYGRDTYESKFYGIDYSYKLFTFGYKHSDYGVSKLDTYKLRMDYYLGNFVLSGAGNFLSNDSQYYMSQLSYKNIGYQQFFNFEELNSGILSFDKTYFDMIENKVGIKKDYNHNFYSVLFDLGVIF